MRQVVLALLFALTIVGLHAQQPAAPITPGVTKFDPALDAIISSDAKPEVVKNEHWGFLEGPVWVQERGGGYLLFSDVAANNIYKYTPGDGKFSVFLKDSGYTGTEPLIAGGQSFNGRIHIVVFGSNGLTLDPQGRVVIATHGNRTIERLEKDGKRTVLAERYNGKHINSPNDLVVKSDGTIYFTDPPGGLRGAKDPRQELPYSGVFMVKDGKVQVLIDDPAGRPNGLAFTPDEKFLYVNGLRKITKYKVKPDGTIANGQLFTDMNDDPLPGGTDGMKVDQQGNVYCTGAGGIWIISPSGKHLGTIRVPETPANLAFGDADGKTAYITARQGLYKVRVKIPGVRPGPPAS